MEEGEEEMSEEEEAPVAKKGSKKGKIIEADAHAFSSDSSEMTPSEEPSYMRDSVNTSELDDIDSSEVDKAYDQGFINAHHLDTYRRTKRERIQNQAAEEATEAH